MKYVITGLLLVLAAVMAFAQVEVTPSKGNGFDGGAVFVSSCAVRQSGSTTWSITNPAIDSSAYSTSKNTDWLLKNRKEYDVMVDSCIWTNKGTEALLGVDMPYLMEKGEWGSVDGKCTELVHMRILSELRGWTTVFYMKTFKK
jgi:hypothetical protein